MSVVFQLNGSNLLVTASEHFKTYFHHIVQHVGFFNILYWLCAVHALCCIVTGAQERMHVQHSHKLLRHSYFPLHALRRSRCPCTAPEHHIRTERGAVQEPEQFAKAAESFSYYLKASVCCIVHYAESPNSWSTILRENTPDCAEIAGQSSQWNRIGRYMYTAIRLCSQPEAHN